jgi:hypothetical protein
MTWRAVRLAVAALAFVAWVSWLAWLAATVTRPVVLSRPQLLAAELLVLAQVDDPTKAIQVRQAWTRSEGRPRLQGLVVTNLVDCRAWAGPGEYLLPIATEPGAANTYHVVRTPYSPGIDPHAQLPRVYPAVTSVREQLQQVVDEQSWQPLPLE